MDVGQEFLPLDVDIQCQQHVRAAGLFAPFVQNTSDVSTHKHFLTEHGNVNATFTGVHFDGDGDYLSVPTFDYAADATFAISVWFTKPQCQDGTRSSSSAMIPGGSIYSHQSRPIYSENDAGIDVYLVCGWAAQPRSTSDFPALRYSLRDDAAT